MALDIVVFVEKLLCKTIFSGTLLRKVMYEKDTLEFVVWNMDI